MARNKVGCASVHKQETAKIRLPDHSSIFSAEAVALNIALCSIRNNNNKKFIVFSDSFVSFYNFSNILTTQIHWFNNFLENIFTYVDQKR